MSDPAQVLVLDGFDDALIGPAERFGWDTHLLAYDTTKIIEILMEKGMEHEEAHEFFHHNILGAWAGEGTPIFVNTSCEFSELIPDTETSD